MTNEKKVITHITDTARIPFPSNILRQDREGTVLQ